MPSTAVSAWIPASFSTGDPVAVPLEIPVRVKNVDSRDVGLRGVAVECYDETLERLARHELGDFSWRGAAPSNRSTETHDAGWLSVEQVVYRAEWTHEITVETGAVPHWITFDVADYWIGDDDEASKPRAVGVARATPPTPEFSARVLKYVGDRPVPATVEKQAYEDHRFTTLEYHGDLLGDPLFPEGLYPDRDLVDVSVTVSPNPARVGDDLDVSAEANFADGSREDVSRAISVRVVDERIAARPNSFASIRAREPGRTTIVARYRGQTAVTSLLVTERPTPTSNSTGASTSTAPTDSTPTSTPEDQAG